LDSIGGSYRASLLYLHWPIRACPRSLFPTLGYSTNIPLTDFLSNQTVEHILSHYILLRGASTNSN